MEVLHARIQHGVGQGSFHSASVEVKNGSDRIRFDYVYDCGAMAGTGMSKALKRAIARLGLECRAGSSGRGVLDVMVLSHYDSDHLNGAKQLSHTFDVRRIFLPYLSPRELPFVIADQAEALSTQQIRELHGLAFGSGALWGRPVTMVAGGERVDGVGSEVPKGPLLQEGALDDRSEAPQNVRLKIGPRAGERADRAVPSQMSHHDDVSVECADGQPLWKLRFWNREPSHTLLAEIESQLISCGFPLSRLRDSSGIGEVVAWLAIPKNRARTVEAYRNAIAAVKPMWAHEANSRGIANLLSLAMYAGPDFDVVEMHYLNRHHIDRRYRCLWCGPVDAAGTGGWLGTGDAPLGESTVWTDFNSHYSDKLSTVSTYLVPHHGAAPSGGPRYYHAGLNHAPGVASVISYGLNNNYGHPRSSVLTQILAEHGDVYRVTEASEDGFQEVFRFTGI